MAKKRVYTSNATNGPFENVKKKVLFFLSWHVPFHFFLMSLPHMKRTISPTIESLRAIVCTGFEQRARLILYDTLSLRTSICATYETWFSRLPWDLIDLIQCRLEAWMPCEVHRKVDDDRIDVWLDAYNHRWYVQRLLDDVNSPPRDTTFWGITTYQQFCQFNHATRYSFGNLQHCNNCNDGSVRLLMAMTLIQNGMIVRPWLACTLYRSSSLQAKQVGGSGRLITLLDLTAFASRGNVVEWHRPDRVTLRTTYANVDVSAFVTHWWYNDASTGWNASCTRVDLSTGRLLHAEELKGWYL